MLTRFVWEEGMMERLNKGDPELAARLERSIKACASIGLRVLSKNRESLVEDVAQELRILFWEKMDTFWPGCPIEPFLIRAAENKSYELAKKLFPLIESGSLDDEDWTGGTAVALGGETILDDDYPTPYHVPDRAHESHFYSPSAFTIHRQTEKEKALEALIQRSQELRSLISSKDGEQKGNSN